MTITTIKFFYNGIKINGEKALTKINVYDCDDEIRIIYDWHWGGEFFEAIQEIAEYSFEAPRYWDDEGNRKIAIKKDNPLYNCFKYMVLANKLRDFKYYDKTTGKGKDKIAEIEAEMKKFPKVADEKTVEAAKKYIIEVKEEIKRHEEIKRQKEEEERRKIFEEERAQKMVITDYMNKYPIGDSKTYVRICWSEHPAFYDWDDNELTLSIKAAEKVFQELDKKPVDGGYYKTKFEIVEDGETIYTGRYDLGDEEDGLFKHLINFADYTYKTDGNEEDYKNRIALVNHLTDVYNAQFEVVVTFAKGFSNFVAEYKKNKEQKGGV